jgi:heme-degrading monooxygenase HmoA
MTVTLEEMDPHVTFAEQLDQPTGSVVLINTFTIAPEDAEHFLTTWSADAAFMKRQPGFIATQLHRGIGGSGTFVNVAVWESAAALGAAFRSPEFQAFAARYPAGVIARPHLFQKVAVPGVCVA